MAPWTLPLSRARTLTLALVCCLLGPVGSSHAAVYTLRPNATINSTWTAAPNGSAASAVLDDPVLQPNAPPTNSDYLTATVAGRTAEVEVDTQALAAGDTVLSTTAWAYVGTGTRRTVTITLLSGTTVLGSNTVPAGMAPTWHTVPSTSGLTQAQVDALRVRVSLAGSGAATASYVYAAYVSLQTAGVLTANTTASPSFAATLDGSDRVAAYTTSLDIADTRETASGWHLTAAATQFATAGPTPQTLPADASSISGVTATCAIEPCIAPVNAIAYPVAVAAGGPPVKFFSAGSGSGSGRFTIEPTTSVTIPANADAGAYSSTVTYTLASGP